MESSEILQAITAMSVKIDMALESIKSLQTDINERRESINDLDRRILVLEERQEQSEKALNRRILMWGLAATLIAAGATVAAIFV